MDAKSHREKEYENDSSSIIIISQNQENNDCFDPNENQSYLGQNDAQSRYETKKQSRSKNEVIHIKKTKKKKKPKTVNYGIMSIPNPKQLRNSELFYMHGDILIDFQKKNTDFFEDRYSLWNFCKIWPITVINNTSKTLMFKLEQRISPSQSNKNIYLQIQRYKSYPDQTIHSLMDDIEKVSSLNEWIGEYLISYFTQIMLQPMMQRQYFYLKEIFDQYMQGIYNQLQKEGAIYFATHSGPDLATFDYIFHRAIFSEPLSLLLGKSLEELQYIYCKNGYQDFFDFESELIAGKMYLDEWLDTIQRFKSGEPPQKKERKKIGKQMRLITFDDIYFYADATIETFKMSDFYVDRNNPLDFYARIIYFDVSPTTIKQIMTLREQQQKQNEQFQCIPQPQDQNDHENLRYTLQAEIFKEKFIDADKNEIIQKINVDNLENKTCKYRII